MAVAPLVRMSEPAGKSRSGITLVILAAVLTLSGCASPYALGDGAADDGGLDEPGFQASSTTGSARGGPIPPSDPCQGVTCSEHGTCHTIEGAPACDCAQGYQAAGLSCLPAAPGASGCLEGSSDFAQEGPYGSATLPGPLGTTVFYPARWQQGCLHPIAAWGNGTGVVGTFVYAHLNRHVASWGIVVIASPNPMAGTGIDLALTIDWLLAQNEDPASPFFHRLSPRAGVAGHSQGGIGSSIAALHPSVVAQVNVQGGGTSFGRATLLIGGDLDFMFPSIVASWFLSSGPTFLAGMRLTDHIIVPSILGAATPQGIQVKRLYAAWYRCFLADDANACALFRGGDACGLCDEPQWFDLRSKNL